MSIREIVDSSSNKICLGNVYAKALILNPVQDIISIFALYVLLLSWT